MSQVESSEIVRDETGSQYHIGLRSEDVSDKIVIVGDPERAERTADFFDTVRVSKQNREYVSFTGTYKGLELTVLATGIGCDNTEIAVVELCQLKFPVTMVRCGSCGALQPEIEIGDLVISSGALRLENTSTFFVEAGYPAVASYEVNLALLKSATNQNFPYHFGITATASGFYGAQGRRLPGFPVKDEGLQDRLAKQGIKNFEMESSTLFTLACLRGFRAGSVCAVFASRPRNEFIVPEKKVEAESKAIKTALGAFELLNKMDQQKGDAPFWLPDIK
ncbi:MAG: nucleoside phosphorylase [Desulfobacteraceae bacterium]|jgi:uridine phosphorylase